jgi:hypothetical protein
MKWRRMWVLGLGLLAPLQPAQPQDVPKALDERGSEARPLPSAKPEIPAKNTELEPRSIQPTTGFVTGFLEVSADDADAAPAAPITYDTYDAASCDSDGCRSGGFIFSIEYLRWITRQTNSPFGGILTDISGGALVGSSVIAGVDARHDWDNGIRIGLGFRTAGGWDFGIRYTGYEGAGSRTIGDFTLNSDGIFANLLDRSLADDLDLNGLFDEGIVDFAAQRVKTVLDIWDLSIGRSFNPADNFELSVASGLRIARLDQDSTTFYGNLEGAADLDSAATLQSFRMDGVGVRFGLDTAYHFGSSGLAIVSGAGLSLLYAEFDITRVDVQINRSLAEVGVRGITVEEDGVVPIVEAKLGLHYSADRFSVGVGYDFANWFNVRRQVDVPGYDDVNDTTSNYRTDNGSVSFDGWYFLAGVRY